MKKVLFLIHDLGEGGAEKVLLNLVNNMDYKKFDITVMTLFDVGVNRQFLNSNIKYKYCFKKMPRGNSYFMKLLSPEKLHTWLIKDDYDIEISYLEGPSTRVISGCLNKNTKKVAWIHSTIKSMNELAGSFRSVKEMNQCYEKFDKIVTVSEEVKKSFLKYSISNVSTIVLYNTNESKKIRIMSKENIENPFLKDEFNIIGVGKLTQNKGFDRIIRIIRKLRDENKKVHLYLLGDGEMKSKLEELTERLLLKEYVTFLGYQTNPYKYISKSDLYICSSHSEGFSTATTEALIIGVPVCTMNVSGMKEMLGENNEYGIIVNSEKELFHQVSDLICNSKRTLYYKRKAIERGNEFDTENTVKKVEQMLDKLCEE